MLVAEVFAAYDYIVVRGIKNVDALFCRGIDGFVSIFVSVYIFYLKHIFVLKFS